MSESTSASSKGKTTWFRNGKLRTKRGKSTIFVCTDKESEKSFIAKTIIANNLVARTELEIERRMYEKSGAVESPYFVKYLGFNIEADCDAMKNLDVCNLFMEWVRGDNLKEYLRHQTHVLDEKVLAVFCRDILKGLDYLHKQGKVHGDIKASNIIVARENLKICDLGKGKILKDGDVYIRPRFGQDPFRKCIFTTGSEFFRAPEVVNETEQGPPSDIFALGCTLVEMATGFPPPRIPRIYTSQDVKDIDLTTAFYKSTLHIQTHFSAECFHFLHLCLSEDPQRRPSAETLLKHAWFTKFPLVYPKDTNQTKEYKKCKFFG